jgi:hypothetical protein
VFDSHVRWQCGDHLRWWGQTVTHNNKGIRWLACDRLTSPKSQGGFGFCDFQAFNRAMIAEQNWNIIQNPNSLVSRIFKARYFSHCSLLESNLGFNSSHVLRSTWNDRHIIWRNCRWIIDDESKTNEVKDPWIYNGASKWVCAPLASGLYHMHVNDLTIEDMECQMLIN